MNSAKRNSRDLNSAVAELEQKSESREFCAELNVIHHLFHFDTLFFSNHSSICLQNISFQIFTMFSQSKLNEIN